MFQDVIIVSNKLTYILIFRLNNTQNEVASEEMPVSLIDAEKMLKELEDLKVEKMYSLWQALFAFCCLVVQGNACHLIVLNSLFQSLFLA